MPGRVVIKVELDEDVYRKLLDRARSSGYALVVDYVRDLLYRVAEGGFGEGGFDRVGEVIVKRVERVVSDLVNPFTGKIDEVSRRLAELIEKLESSEEAAEKPSVDYGRVQRGQHRMGALDRLKVQKVVFWDDVSWMKAPERLFMKLEREGAIVFEVSGEKVAVDRDFWDEFVRVVEGIGVRDPDESSILVASSLGDKAASLFKRLVKAGLAYYDEDLGHWVIPQP